MGQLSSILLFLAFGVFICGLVRIDGQYMYLGRCLNLPTQPNFKVGEYLGRWYTVEQYSSPLSGSSACQTFEFMKPDDVGVQEYGKRSFQIFVSQVSITGWNSETGVAYLRNRTEPAKYVMDVEGIPSMAEVPYWIMATDYKNYSLVWSCVDEYGPFNFQMIWFLSRTPRASRYSRDRAYNAMRRLGINTRIMTTTHQRFCQDPPEPETAGDWRVKSKGKIINAEE